MLLCPISSSQLNPIVVRVRFGQIFASYILLVLRIPCKLACPSTGTPLTVVFLTFSVFAQGEGGGGVSKHSTICACK